MIGISIFLIILPHSSAKLPVSVAQYCMEAMATLLQIFSTLTLLLLPKVRQFVQSHSVHLLMEYLISLVIPLQVYLVRGKDNSKSAVRFLFVESVKRFSGKGGAQSDCFACFKSRSSQSDSTIGDSILAQEIDTLKQLLREVSWELSNLLAVLRGPRVQCVIHSVTVSQIDSVT